MTLLCLGVGVPGERHRAVPAVLAAHLRRFRRGEPPVDPLDGRPAHPTASHQI